MATKVYCRVRVHDGIYVITIPGYGVTQALSCTDVMAMAIDYLYCWGVSDPVLRVDWSDVITEMRHNERWGLLA